MNSRHITQHISSVYGKIGICILVLVMAWWMIWKRERPVQITLGIYAGSSWNVPIRTESRVMDAAIQAFEKKHPNVKVVYESGILKEDYSDWLSDQILKGEQPDIFMIPPDDFSLLAATGALKNLDSNIARELSLDNFYEVSLKAGQYRGKQFALPFESNPMMMCVNKDLLDKEGISIPEAGWTLQDLYHLCRRLTKDTNGDGVIDQFGITGYSWQEALQAYGGSLFPKDSETIDVVSPQMKEALSFMTRLNALSGNYQVTSDDFDQGKVAFFPMSLAQYRTYMPYPYHVAKYSNFSWTCIQMPAQVSVINATRVDTSLFSISSQSRHEQLAWEFLQFVTSSPTIQQNVMDQSQGISVLKEVVDSQKTKETLQAENLGVSLGLTSSTLNQLMEGATVTPTVKHYKDLVEQADYLISKVIGEETLDIELQELQKDLEDKR